MLPVLMTVIPILGDTVTTTTSLSVSDALYVIKASKIPIDLSHPTLPACTHGDRIRHIYPPVIPMYICIL